MSHEEHSKAAFSSVGEGTSGEFICSPLPQCSTIQPGHQDKNYEEEVLWYEAHQNNIFSLKPL